MRLRSRFAADFEARRARLASAPPDPAVEAPRRLLAAVVEHQIQRAGAPEVASAATVASAPAEAHMLTGWFPLLDLEVLPGVVAREAELAAQALAERGVLPEGLAAAWEGAAAGEALPCETWLEDPLAVDPAVGALLELAAAPVLEAAAARSPVPGRERWQGRACPLCGALARCAVIVEESGGFMQGAPRYLVCSRCSASWGFARATCPWCGEDDSTRIDRFYDEARPWAGVDVCSTCRTYTKSFDLRTEDRVAPVVDDLLTLTLDVWAREHGFARPVTSIAGV